MTSVTPQSDQSLPDEWNSVNQRILSLETTMLRISKKQAKIERKVAQQEECLAELKKHCQHCLPGTVPGGAQESLREQITELFREISSLWKQVEGQERIERLLERNKQQNKAYIDSTVLELRLLLKEKSGGEKGVSNSKQSKMRLMESGAKRSINEYQQESPSSSRVSYLKEKLKEFEKISRKYEERPGDALTKLRNMKDYLEESVSELEQSNVDIDAEYSPYEPLKTTYEPLKTTTPRYR